MPIFSSSSQDCRDYIYLDAEEFSSYFKKPWREAFAEQRYTDDLLRNRMLNEIFQETVPVISARR